MPEGYLRREDGGVQPRLTALSSFCRDVLVGTAPGLTVQPHATRQHLQHRMMDGTHWHGAAVLVSPKGDRMNVVTGNIPGTFAAEQLKDGTALARQPSEGGLIVDASHKRSRRKVSAPLRTDYPRR